MKECWNCGKPTESPRKMFQLVYEGKVTEEIFGSLCDDCNIKIERLKKRSAKRKTPTTTLWKRRLNTTIFESV